MRSNRIYHIFRWDNLADLENSSDLCGHSCRKRLDLKFADAEYCLANVVVLGKFARKFLLAIRRAHANRCFCDHTGNDRDGLFWCNFYGGGWGDLIGTDLSLEQCLAH